MVLPALYCLEKHVTLAGIYSRSVKRLVVGGGFELTTTTSLDGIDFGSIDVIIVAIPPERVASLLGALARRDTRHITLMLDTPVLPPRHLGAQRHFSRFRRVVVSEDNFALPPIRLARRLVEQHRIGRIKQIQLLHSGYKHHALAMLKQLTGARHVSAITQHRWARRFMEKRVRLPGGITATLVEPRDYGVGRFLIVGETGAIADYGLEGEDVHRIGYRLDAGRYAGLALNGEAHPRDSLDEAYFAHMSGSAGQGSLMDSLKIRGLMELIVASTPGDPGVSYGARDGLYDVWAIRQVEKIGYFRDFAVSAGGPSVVHGMIRLLGRVLASPA